jgi:2-hydroxychromene-2-carboxylate isomerase
MPEAPIVELFFDCSSPGTYLAFHTIQDMAREIPFTIAWRPILVGGVFNAVNRDVYDRRGNMPEVKSLYFAKALQDWAALAGLIIRWPPPVLPVNSVKAMRGVIVAQRHGRVVDVARATFEAFWKHGEDISREEVLGNICDRAGFDRGIYFTGIAEDGIKAELRDNTDELIARGGFGSPTMFVDGGDMQWGNDHLPLIRASVLRKLAETEGHAK